MEVYMLMYVFTLQFFSSTQWHKLQAGDHHHLTVIAWLQCCLNICPSAFTVKGQWWTGYIFGHCNLGKRIHAFDWSPLRNIFTSTVKHILEGNTHFVVPVNKKNVPVNKCTNLGIKHIKEHIERILHQLLKSTT